MCTVCSICAACYGDRSEKGEKLIEKKTEMKNKRKDKTWIRIGRKQSRRVEWKKWDDWDVKR